jgi:hypothetical protein
MHEKEIFSGTPASENGPRDPDLRLAFGEHAVPPGGCACRLYYFPGPTIAVPASNSITSMPVYRWSTRM